MGNTKLSECSNDGISDYAKTHYVNLMGGLEAELGCAGMCEVPKLYLFSTVAR